MSDILTRKACKWAQWSCMTTAIAIIATIMAWPLLSRAANPALLCETAARNAAQRHDVPLDVMRTIALVETGRSRNGQIEPWPWALNMGGPGFWPDSRTAALAKVRSQLDAGRRNIDLGCFQVNYHWHGQNFASLDDMIDPEKNADYAARLLRQHKARLGTWEAAAGAYHSGTPALATRYIERFRALRGTARDPVPAQLATAAAPAPRQNTYRLLQPTGEQRLGSLVPLHDSPGQPLIQFTAQQ